MTFLSVTDMDGNAARINFDHVACYVPVSMLLNGAQTPVTATRLVFGTPAVNPLLIRDAATDLDKRLAELRRPHLASVP